MQPFKFNCCSPEIQSLVNNISAYQEQINWVNINANNSKINNFSSQISILANNVIKSEGSNFKALDWIYLRENLLNHVGREKSSEIDNTVINISKKMNPGIGWMNTQIIGWDNFSKERKVYNRMAFLCDIGTFERKRNINVILDAVQEINIDKNAIKWSRELGSGDFYWETHARALTEGMSDWELAAIMRAVAHIEKEKRADTIKKIRPYIQNYFTARREFTKDMSGYVIAALLQAVYEGCEDEDIKDAIEKTKSLTKEFCNGHEKGFLEGILAVPKEEREAFTKEMKELIDPLLLFFSEKINAIVFFYLLPSHLRTKEKIVAGFLSNPEHQSAFIASRKQKIHHGITPFAQIQFDKFTKALKLAEQDTQDTFMQWAIKPTMQIQKVKKEPIELPEDAKKIITSADSVEVKEIFSKSNASEKKSDEKLEWKLDLAKKMLSKGFSIEDICDLTELSPKDINEGS